MDYTVIDPKNTVIDAEARIGKTRLSSLSASSAKIAVSEKTA